MDFSEQIMKLSERAQKIKHSLTTEEATKTSLILPFINALGYDIFDPIEVVPEFTADVAGRKGEKIDYAIMHEGKPIILIECKCCGSILDNSDKHEQLHRYFITVDSRIGILTDGIRYLFYSDIDESKKMDSRPFMEINLDDVDVTLIPELRKLCKGKFDLQTALDTAYELKYNREFKNILLKQMTEPSEGFVDFFIRETYEGRATKNIREQFTSYVNRAFNEFIAERIDDRLKNALAATPKKEEIPSPETDEQENTVITTEDELLAYYLVKSLLMDTISPNRIHLRDVLSYSSVLLDDNNRKPIVRFYFNNPERKRIELFNQQKERTLHDIEKIEDILFHTEIIKRTAQLYEG